MFCSILISNYNKEKYLKECLSSCVNQDYNNYEILVGDNGSSDKSIDFRLITYFYNFRQNLSITDQELTWYLNNNDGNESKYKKYTPRWWKRRSQSFDFLIEILKKKNIDHDKTIDYRVTRFLNKIF